MPTFVRGTTSAPPKKEPENNNMLYMMSWLGYHKIIFLFMEVAHGCISFLVSIVFIKDMVISQKEMKLVFLKI